MYFIMRTRVNKCYRINGSAKKSRKYMNKVRYISTKTWDIGMK